MSISLKLIKRFIIFLLSLAIPFRVFRFLFIERTGLGWAVPTVAILSATFIVEAWVSLRGRKTIWQYFEARDKVVFAVSMTKSLILLTFPLKMQLSSSVGILFGAIGLTINWVIIRFFGSPSMREVIFGLITSRQIDKDFDDNT